MNTTKIIIIIVAVILLGVVILPLINRAQFRKMPVDQQILAIMKQAKKLEFFKNISYGRHGNLCFVKNKRKILVYPWVIDPNGRMVITAKEPFKCWDYPEDHPALTKEEATQARNALDSYAQKSSVRIVWNDVFENDETEGNPD